MFRMACLERIEMKDMPPQGWEVNLAAEMSCDMCLSSVSKVWFFVFTRSLLLPSSVAQSLVILLRWFPWSIELYVERQPIDVDVGQQEGAVQHADEDADVDDVVAQLILLFVLGLGVLTAICPLLLSIEQVVLLIDHLTFHFISSFLSYFIPEYIESSVRFFRLCWIAWCA